MSFPDHDEADHVREAEISAQKELILKQILSAEARLRLNNVKMVKSELANSVENYLINAASQGQIKPPVSDDQLKQILLSLQQPKRDFKITRR